MSTTTRERPLEPQVPKHRRQRHGRLPLVAQVAGSILILVALVLVLFPNHAGADELTNGKVTLMTTGSGASTVATSPLSNGQVVDVSVAPNSTMARSSLETAGFDSGAVPIKVLECADPGASTAGLPTKPTQCEPATIDSISGARADGSFVVNNFTVYALPNVAVLGPSNGTECDSSDHPCVLGLFSNQNDFTKPHIFSAPFEISAGPLPNTSGAASGGSSSPGSAASPGAGAGVSLAPTTLAFTGTSTAFPWLLASGLLLLVAGTVLRLRARKHS